MYQYRREDNGKIVQVDFEANMSMDVAGFITTKIKGKDVVCRKVRDEPKAPRQSEERSPIYKTFVSDTMGFSGHQLADFEADRKKHGFSDVEFVREPGVDFYQVHVKGPEALERYRKHRSFYDMNSRNGGGITMPPGHLEEAQERVRKMHPRREKT